MSISKCQKKLKEDNELIKNEDNHKEILNSKNSRKLKHLKKI